MVIVWTLELKDKNKERGKGAEVHALYFCRCVMTYGGFKIDWNDPKYKNWICPTCNDQFFSQDRFDFHLSICGQRAIPRYQDTPWGAKADLPIPE
eukprot:g53988.t1